MRRQHGHSDKPVSIALVQFRRQTGGFTPEDEDDIGRRAEWHIPKQSRRPRRKEVRIAKHRKLALERFPTWPHARLDMFPVVEAGPFQLTFTKRKAKRSDQVQNSPGGEARTTRISSVPVNFGMHEYNMRCH
jgi:hypothetical protein